LQSDDVFSQSKLKVGLTSIAFAVVVIAAFAHSSWQLLRCERQRIPDESYGSSRDGLSEVTNNDIDR